MLTEVGHGLDAVNLQTQATLLPDGTFDLHTPHGGAAKYCPAFSVRVLYLTICQAYAPKYPCP